MSVELRFGDFFHPLSIVALKRFMDRSQWFDGETLRQYQLRRLNQILRHACDQSPYYQERYPRRIESLDELKTLPVLTKELLRTHGRALLAANHRRFHPIPCQTSGTTGSPVRFYLDKSANVLEFCYYWRYWGWAGYRLGVPFADLGLHYFLDRDVERVSHFDPLTRRLSLNAAQLSEKNVGELARAIRRHRARFIKGPPSGLFMLATLLERQGIRDLSMAGAFTTGECLHSHQRRAIERVFSCRVQDSYGHMERTVGVCQCPEGGYHINSEYGILEMERVDELSTEETEVGRVIGTSLHNFAMPLIRYRTGDLIEIKRDEKRCACGRGLPLCARILGREQDLLVTPDGRYIANAAILFNFVKGVQGFQIVQHERDRFVVRVVADAEFTSKERDRVVRTLRRLVGPASVPMSAARPSPGQKYRSVVSHVGMER